MSKAYTRALARIRAEHEAMRECPHCGGSKTSFRRQMLCGTSEADTYDVLVYYCSTCDKEYSKDFPIPDEHWEDIDKMIQKET